MMKISASSSQIKRKPRAVSTFLKKTYDFLCDSDNYDAVRWAPNGIGFIIINEELFSQKVLPKYFKHSNYSSFVRQLNMYNFHKIRQTSQESYFHHEHFDRSNRSAMTQIKRKPEKKKKKNQSSEEDGVSQNEENLMLNKNQKVLRESLGDIFSEKKISIKVLKDSNSEKKVESEKITRHIFESEAYNENELLENQSENHSFSMLVEEDERPKNSERRPRLTTKELICASKGNIFPISIEKVQTSVLSIFY